MGVGHGLVRSAKTCSRKCVRCNQTSHMCRGVATWWTTGVDPLLPEVVPEIDANPVSFYSGGGRWGSVMVWYDRLNRVQESVSAMRVHPTIFDLATPLHM